MTCHDHRAALLDLARGVPIPTAVVRAAEAHADDCPACAAELGRQQRLTEDFRALAEASQEWTAPAALEARLMRAFAAQQPFDAGAEPRWRLWWLPAGAAMAAAALLAIWVARGAEFVGGAPGTATTAPRAASGGEPRISQPPAIASKPVPSGVAVDTGQPRRAPVARRHRPIEFMLIPAAIGLPALESASIVRLELPVSVLPAYGLEIVPDARRSEVEADVLVGQDGQPRGIRLVPEHESVVRSRQ